MYSAVFQAGGLVVVLVEVVRKAYLASIVPVIVNAILDNHQLVVDIVAFVSKGDFPRSRLGEKQRGKILGSWVSRKLRTIAQFNIREGDGADSQITEVAEPRSGVGSVVGVGSSLRNVESAGTTPPVSDVRGQSGDFTSLPTGISEMPATYESSIIESPRLPNDEDREDTPTELHPKYTSYHQGFQNDYDQSGSIGKAHSTDLASEGAARQSQIPDLSSEYPEINPYSYRESAIEEDITPQASSNPQFDFNPDTPPPEARYDSKPTLSSNLATGGLSSLPSQQRYSAQFSQSQDGRTGEGPIHGLRGGSGGGAQAPHAADDDDSSSDSWRRDALMQMNLAQGGIQNGGQTGHPGRNTSGSGPYRNDYDGNGYGYGHAL